MARRLIVEADGGSRGNPGVAGYGALVRDAETGAVLVERSAPLGTASNNVAEYSGLIAGLEAAYAIEPGADVDVAMDSKLVIEQMSGRWKIKHEDMRRLALEARDLVAQITAAGGSVSFRWIPREENKAADALSNKGMDGETIYNTLGGESAVDDLPALVPLAATKTGRAPVSTSAPVSPRPPPHLGTPTRIVLVRHGVTDFTAEGRVDGRGGADPSLNTAGQAQAAAAGRAVAHLLGGSEARVITSSLMRAIETGAAVGEAVGITPEIDPDWDEQGFGDWDGQAIGDLIENYPDDMQAMRFDPAYARPGGESHDEMAERVLAAYDRAIAAGGTSIIVCHRKPIMVVLAHILGMPHDRSWRLAAAPGSLSALEVWADGNVSVAFTNRT